MRVEELTGFGGRRGRKRRVWLGLANNDIKALFDALGGLGGVNHLAIQNVGHVGKPIHDRRHRITSAESVGVRVIVRVIVRMIVSVSVSVLVLVHFQVAVAMNVLVRLGGYPEDEDGDSRKGKLDQPHGFVTHGSARLCEDRPATRLSTAGEEGSATSEKQRWAGQTASQPQPVCVVGSMRTL